MHNINQVPEYLAKLESEERYSSTCRICKEEFLPILMQGKEVWEVFAPPHKASPYCKSSRYNHCTCDICF